jgi:hypothetical protein
MDSHRDNLQKSWRFWIVKNKIISDIPHCPNNGAYSHSYLHDFFLGNTLQPVTKEISYIFWWNKTKSHVYNAPYYLGKRAFKKEVLYCFFLMTETTRLATIPISLA